VAGPRVRRRARRDSLACGRADELYTPWLGQLAKLAFLGSAVHQFVFTVASTLPFAVGQARALRRPLCFRFGSMPACTHADTPRRAGVRMLSVCKALCECPSLSCTCLQLCRLQRCMNPMSSNN